MDGIWWLGFWVVLLSILIVLIMWLIGGPLHGLLNPQRRLERARSSGQIRAELQVYAQAGRADQVERVIKRYLPDWPVRRQLMATAQELMQLQKSAAIARSKGVAASLTDEFARYALSATNALWQTTDGIAGVAAQGVSYNDVQTLLEPRAERMRTLAQVSSDARKAIAELTLRGSEPAELQRAQSDLSTLAEAIQQLESSERSYSG